MIVFIATIQARLETADTVAALRQVADRCSRCQSKHTCYSRNPLAGVE